MGVVSLQGIGLFLPTPILCDRVTHVPGLMCYRCTRSVPYNTLTTNCTTTLLMHTRMNPESPPMSWKVLVSGYVPSYLYELGRIDVRKPFAELEKHCHVNERANAADKDPDFSQRIRVGLPMPEPFALRSEGSS
jgi:hypothetical protein